MPELEAVACQHKLFQRQQTEVESCYDIVTTFISGFGYNSPKKRKENYANKK
jgi:uncharacterized protein YutE (UPF0331/DUF86 family)